MKSPWFARYSVATDSAPLGGAGLPSCRPQRCFRKVSAKKQKELAAKFCVRFGDYVQWKMPVKVFSQASKSNCEDGLVKVEGPKGKLSHKMPTGRCETGGRSGDRFFGCKAGGKGRLLFGLSRTMVANMVHGVNTRLSRELEIIGVVTELRRKVICLPSLSAIRIRLTMKCRPESALKWTTIQKVTVAGADKMIVGMVAAKIRSFREPRQYRNGIRYAGEHIVRKQGKSAGAK